MVESFSVGVREEGLDSICARIRQRLMARSGGLCGRGRLYLETAREALDSGKCDVVMFGRDFIPTRICAGVREDLPLTPWIESRFIWRSGRSHRLPLEEKEEKR